MVKKGDLLVELGRSFLADEKVDQEIVLLLARGNAGAAATQVSDTKRIAAASIAAAQASAKAVALKLQSVEGESGYLTGKIKKVERQIEVARRYVRILEQNDRFAGLYSQGVPAKLIAERSRRVPIERSQEMRRVRRELVAGFGHEGMNEGAAMLRANKEMQRLGYYPKTPTISARRLGDHAADGGIAELPLFEIADGEMQSGIFPDIEQAIAGPGIAVDKDMGKYVIHQHYDNSAKLNALLASGGERFRVRYLGELYEITIDRP